MLSKKIIFFLGVFCLLASGCRHNQNKKLVIATAANMQFAMKELTAAFTAGSGVDCEIILSSSGKLTAQIMEGAPFDILVSANMKYPDELYKNGFSKNEPVIYAYGKLALWSMDNEINPSIELLGTDKIKHIALANPKTAPYGQAAVEVLNHYNIFEKTRNKLVYGESIAQTNQFIISEAAEIGFTALSVVLSPEMKNKGQYLEINSDIHSSIAQGIIILRKSKKQIQAQQFSDFLFSEKGREILNTFGYAVKINN